MLFIWAATPRFEIQRSALFTVKQSAYASYRSYLNKHFCVLGNILLKKLEPHTLQEFYNYKFREEGLSIASLAS